MEITLLYPLPIRVRGFCKETPDGDKIYVLNACHTFETNKKTLLHELSHANDFGRSLDVDALERERHRG